MMFIELENSIINVSEICSIKKKFSPYDRNKIFGIEVSLSNGETLSFDKDYYEKISKLLKPTILIRDDKEGIYQ